MDTIKEKAKRHLYKYIEKDDLNKSDLFELDLLTAMIEFARECCEEQKVECSGYSYSAGYEIAILNCKNICDN